MFFELLLLLILYCVPSPRFVGVFILEVVNGVMAEEWQGGYMANFSTITLS